MALLDNQWWRHGDDIAGAAHHQALPVTGLEYIIGARAGCAIATGQMHCADQAGIANINHVMQVLETVQRLLPVDFQLAGAGQQTVAGIDIQGRQASGGGHRMTGVGVAVEQFDQALRAVHKGILDLAADKHRAHGNGAVGQALGGGHDVRGDFPALCGKGLAQSAVTGNDLVEDQQNAMLGRDLAQALEIAHRRQYDASGTGHRLDNHGSNVFRAVQGHQLFQLVSQFHAMLGQPATEGVAFQVQGVRQVVNAGQLHAKGLAIVDHAANGNAAEADTVVTQLAADQPGAGAFTAGALVGQGNFQRGIH